MWRVLLSLIYQIENIHDQWVVFRLVELVFRLHLMLPIFVFRRPSHRLDPVVNSFKVLNGRILMIVNRMLFLS